MYTFLYREFPDGIPSELTKDTLIFLDFQPTIV